MSIIKIDNLSFSYGGKDIFENLDLELDSNWKCGLVGRNGVGKTTLLKILHQEFDYSGSIHMNEVPRYFPFEVLNPKNNVVDVVETIMPGYEVWKFEKELNLIGVNPDVIYRPFDSLSGGEQVKVLLASLFITEHQYLLIDEPTNHLDSLGRKQVAEYLKGKQGFLLVSHDRKFLDDCIDHIVALNKVSVDVQATDFSTWYDQKLRRDEFNTHKNNRLRKEIGELEESVRNAQAHADGIERTKFGTRGVDRGFIGHKAAKVMKGSKNIQKRQTKMIDERKDLIEDVIDLKDLPLHNQIIQGNLIQFSNVSFQYDQKKIINDLSFYINAEDRIQIRGDNGSGKTTLVKLVENILKPTSGEIFRTSNIKISYVSQDFSYLRGNLEAYAEDHGLDYTEFLTVLTKLGVANHQFKKPIESFSAGQKKKVLLAKSLCEQAHLYIWDEPLNYIDVFTRLQLEELILEKKPTMIFIEHDELFSQSIRTNVLGLS